MSTKALFKQPCDFVHGAVNIDDIPPADLPEVAFVGRSNVGKSSIINALTKRNDLARTSKKPGCTRQLNFFMLGEALMLVDLPGYGYAKASKKEVRGWNRLIRDYLTGRPNLRQVYLLIDARHGLKPNDEEIMSLLDEAAVSYRVLLTKADKQTKEGTEEIIQNIIELAPKHTALHPDTLVTSTKDHMGLDALRGALASFVR